MVYPKLTALELVFTFLTMFGPVTKESLATVRVLFEAVLGYNGRTGKFDKDTVKKVRGVANQLCTLAEIYGVICALEQLETIGGRRAILLLILGPIVEHLTLNNLEEMRNNAVEAMMIVTFKPLGEVQDLVGAWAEEAIKEGVYQTRVSTWTGQSTEQFDQVGANEARDVMTPTSGDISIAANSNALEIVLTLLVMLRPVTKECVGAAKVLFGAVIGFDEAKAKFDKETVRMVSTVAEPLCLLSGQYGVMVEPMMLNTLPGTRAILRVIAGPIIEGHSPTELEEIRNDAEEAMAAVSCKPLNEIRELVATWTCVAKLDGRYQARAATWTGKSMGSFDKAGIIEFLATNEAVREENSSSRSVSPSDLELGSATNIVGLVTIQALSAIGILSAPEFSFKTMFSTPLDVYFGRKEFSFRGDHVGIVEGIESRTKCEPDSDDTEVTNCLMDASDEDDYHRLARYQFPRSTRISPALCSSTGTTPETSPLPKREPANPFVEWMANWEMQEMSVWKAGLRKAAKAEVEAGKRKVIFSGYEDAWETAQLSAWSAALKSHDLGNDSLSGSRASNTPLGSEGEAYCGEAKVSKATDHELVMFICRFFGLI